MYNYILCVTLDISMDTIVWYMKSDEELFAMTILNKSWWYCFHVLQGPVSYAECRVDQYFIISPLLAFLFDANLGQYVAFIKN